MKTYNKPILIEETVEIEDIIAASGTYGGQPGDNEQTFPFGR